MTHTIELAGYQARPQPPRGGPLHLGTRDSYGIERLKLLPGPGWEGLAITVTFHPPGRNRPVRLLVKEDCLVEVPPEATASSSLLYPGRMVFAGLAEGVQRISCDLPYLVADHAPVEGPESQATPSVLEQAVLAAAKSEAAAAESARAAAESREDAAEKAEAAGQSEAAAEKAADSAAASAAEAAQSAASAAESEAAAAESARKAAASEPAGAAGRAEAAAKQAEAARSEAEAAQAEASASAGTAQAAAEEAAQLTGRAEEAAASAAESAQAAQEYLSIAARTVVREIVIPAAGWATDETAPLTLDVAVAGAEESQIPVVSLHPEALAGARDAGLYPVAQTREGAVRLWAKRAPAAELPATLILLSGGGAGGLPIATANTLGGVMIGENVNVTSDGKISVKEIPVPAAEGVMSEIVDRVFSEE